MDIITNSISSVQQKIATKRSKPMMKKKKNKPIKVVYISNPMRVKTSVSEFRALVQELNGQDAEMPPDPSRYGNKMDSNEGCGMKKNGHSENDHALVMGSQVDPDYVEVQKSNGVSSLMDKFEPIDDVFMPQMIENMSVFLQDSVFYECAQVDHQVLMQYNLIHK